MTIQDLVKMKNNSYKFFTEKESLEAVKRDGYLLRYVKNQTDEICLEAVKKYADALQYVNEDVFKITKELTIQEISELLGYNVKIIK